MKGEIIGSNVLVINSQNRGQIGIQGKLVDETKNTIKIKTPDGVKTLIKTQIIIKIQKTSEIIHMNELAIKPEERIKKL
ncbi:ribonuclease P protein subunit [Candidatus Woesearchaeota archaeon]|jgi:ribonuclease P protein subunit POP4|nr:ribonuclease P protein subunit [Candidatus Woesearchaeota archaeon]